jgi:hypothetical protein
MLRPIFLILALSMPLPALAQDSGQGDDLMGRLVQQAINEMLREMFGDMAPTVRELQLLMGEVEFYGPPRVLPNGDILIPRKPDAPDFFPAPGTQDQGAEVEL